MNKCVGAYVINLDKYKSIRTHRIALHVNSNNIIYFDKFGIEHIPKGIIKFIGNKNIKTNNCGTQAYDSTMYEYFCIGFVDFVLKSKTWQDYTNLFSPNHYEKKYKIILKYFQ